MSPFLRAFLPKAGFNRNMDRSIVHGPQKYGGAGYCHNFGEQNASKIHELLAHICHDDEVRNLFRIALSYVQLQAGIGAPVLQHPDIDLPYLEQNWLTTLRPFLAKISASILIPSAWAPELQRQGDVFLMEEALKGYSR